MFKKIDYVLNTPKDILHLNKDIFISYVFHRYSQYKYITVTPKQTAYYWPKSGHSPAIFPELTKGN